MEMDKKRADKLIHKKTLSPLDIPLIKRKNIGLKDVRFAKRIFGK